MKTESTWKVHTIHRGALSVSLIIETSFSFILSLFSPREEISTLSRHASFRRMNSVSTDTRGAVLTLNFFFTRNMLLLLHFVFSDPIQAVRLWHHWSEPVGRWSRVFHTITYSGSSMFYCSEYLIRCFITVVVDLLQQSISESVGFKVFRLR